MNAPAPYALLAELTHRCPLACPYCSNPIALDGRSEELSTEDWVRVFQEAAALGVLQLHLSGGEPATRGDLAQLVAAANAAGLYTNLITSGIGLSPARLEELAGAGLDHVQLSIQDAERASADRIAGLAGAHERKREFARAVTRAGLPLTINAVLHRHNLPRIDEIVAEAIGLGARRVELAHAQYYGWGERNRAALMPSRDAALAARDAVSALKARHGAAIAIDYVPPDFFARYPKPCMNGWGRQSLNVTPKGLALPCHAAQTIPGLVFWSVRDRALADIWQNSPAFAAFRGTEWMREPCRSCARRSIDHGGCRCQALALTGDARNADPVCALSPHHGIVERIVAAPSESYAMRGRPPR